MKALRNYKIVSLAMNPFPNMRQETMELSDLSMPRNDSVPLSDDTGTDEM